MKKSVANGLLVFVTVIWGGGFIATAAALETFQPFYVMMIRDCVSAFEKDQNVNGNKGSRCWCVFVFGFFVSDFWPSADNSQ